MLTPLVRSNASGAEGLRLPPNNALRSIEAGAVSVSFDGSEVALALAPANALDDSYQVHACMHVWERGWLGGVRRG